MSQYKFTAIVMVADWSERGWRVRLEFEDGLWRNPEAVSGEIYTRNRVENLADAVKTVLEAARGAGVKFDNPFFALCLRNDGYGEPLPPDYEAELEAGLALLEGFRDG